jgi:hypothetical protein
VKADEGQSAAKRTLYDGHAVCLLFHFPRLGTISTDFYVAKSTKLLAGQTMNDFFKTREPSVPDPIVSSK